MSCTCQVDTSGPVQPIYAMVSHAGFASGLPFLILLGANIIFARSLRKRTKTELDKAQTEAKVERLARKLRNEQNYVIIMMNLTCFFSVFLIIAILSNFLSANSNKLVDFADNPELSLFLSTLSSVAKIANSSFNLAFYLMSSRMYRDAFKKAVKKMWIA